MYWLLPYIAALVDFNEVFFSCTCPMFVDFVCYVSSFSYNYYITPALHMFANYPSGICIAVLLIFVRDL